MRRKIPFLLLILLLLLALPGAAAADTWEFLPDPPPGTVQWQDPPLYDRYPVWQYVYGADLKRSPDTVHRLFYSMNLVQVGKAWLLKLAIRALEYAAHYDVAGPLVTRAGAAMRYLVNSLWYADNGALVLAALLASAAGALWYGGVRSRRGVGLRILAGTAVILIGGYALFEVAPGTLAQSAGIARALGNQVLEGTAGVAAPAGPQGTPLDRFIRGGGEELWRVFVLAPWVEGEFSDDAASDPAFMDGQLEGGKWLAESPTRREQRYNYLDPTTKYTGFRQWDDTYVLDYLPRRVLLSAVSGVLALVYAGCLLVLAGGVLYYQVLTLVIMALAPVWLLASAFHPRGVGIVRGAVVKAVGALISQVVLMAVLATLLVLTQAMASLADPLGWTAQALLLALVAFVLCRYRFRWLQWGRDPGAEDGARSVSMLGRILSRQAPQPRTAARVERPEPVMVSLPWFRQEAQGALAGAESDHAGMQAVGAEIVQEMRQLRMRLSRAAASAHTAALEGVTADRASTTREQAARGGGEAAARESSDVSPGRRERPAQSQQLHEFRKR